MAEKEEKKTRQKQKKRMTAADEQASGKKQKTHADTDALPDMETPKINKIKAWSPCHKLSKMKAARKMKAKKAKRNHAVSACSAEDLPHKASASAKSTCKSTASKKSQPSKKEKNTKKESKSKPAPCPKVVKLVQNTMAECKASHCCHPNWHELSYDKKSFFLSVYWSRCCVGVKVPKASLPSATQRKSNGNGAKCKWSQVAYFSGATTCVYSNMVLAYEFVAWCLHLFACVSYIYLSFECGKLF